MTWVDLVLLLAFMLGLAAGGYLIARSPTFWVGLGLVIFKRAWPFLQPYFKPLSPEDQKKLDQSRRRAEEWDHFKRKPRDK